MKIKVLSSTLFKESEEDSKPPPVTRLVVKNNSDTTNSRAYLRCMITSNERSTPWLVSDVFTIFLVGLNRMKKLNGLWRHLRIRNGEHFALRLRLFSLRQ